MISETEILSVRNAESPLSPNTSIAYACLIVVLEVVMQTLVFCARQLNTLKAFPIPSTSFVFLTEIFKFHVCYVAFCLHHKRLRFVPSLLFVLPAVCLVVTSYIFFHSMNHMTPPTWDVIVQLRVPIVSVFGCVIFGRPTERRQWLACGPLLLAVGLLFWSCPDMSALTMNPMNATPDEEEITDNRGVYWMLLAICGAASSATSLISSEVIRTVDDRSVLERHTQLHFFAAVISFSWSAFGASENMFEITGRVFFPRDFYLIVVSISVGIVGGLAVTFFTTSLLVDSSSVLQPQAVWTLPSTVLLSATVVWFLFPELSYSGVVTLAVVLLLWATSYVALKDPSEPVLPLLIVEA